MFFKKTAELPTADTALPGRAQPILGEHERHFVNGAPLHGPWPDGLETAVFAMGCFWGVERIFWQIPGVHSTAVGYVNGFTPNATYEDLLKTFWENHDPTQGMRQGGDVGTQYRSGIYPQNDAQASAAVASKAAFQQALSDKGYGEITTEIAQAGPFYYAEDYHQQYLAKNPGGYCGIGGTGVTCPIGVGAEA